MFLTKTSVKKLNTPGRKIREAKFPFKALPLLIAGVVLGFCWLLTLARSPLYLDIGGEDRQDVLYLPADSQGFFAPETHPDLTGDATFRWMGKEASLNLPWPLDAVPLKISLRASAPRPNRFPDQVGTTLSIRKDGLSGIEPERLDITGEYSGKVYEVTLPGHFWPGLQPQNLHFETSDTFQPGKGDPRLLGLVIFDLTIEPDYPQFGLGAWLATLLRPLLLAGLTLLVWWLARLFSLIARWQITLQVITGFLLIISLLYLPLAAEPVYAGWSVLLLAFGSMIWLGAQFAHLALKLPPIFVYIALFLPLMPLAQWLFSGLDLTTISPASAALFLYFAALAVAVMGYIFYRCKFEQIFLGSFLLVSLFLFVYNHWWVFSQNLYKGGDFRNYYQPLLESSQIESPLYSLTEMVQVAYKAVRMPPSFALLIWPYLKIFGRDVNSALFA